MNDAMEIRARITKVDVKYAYARPEGGEQVNIFVPAQAIKWNRNETACSMNQKFSNNEIVNLKIVKQSAHSRRNNCDYVATEIRKIRGEATAESLSQVVHGPEVVIVTSVSQTFAFAESKLGTVFLPGEAFDKNYVNNVEKYLKIADEVVIRYKEQLPKNGCKWKATSAIKQLTWTTDDVKTMNMGNMANFAVDSQKYPIGHGIALEVMPQAVEVFDETTGRQIMCTILTYTGGVQGNYRAKTLQDVINTNDPVMYKAVKENGQYYAISWKKIIDTTDLELEMPKKVKKSESGVQTSSDPLALVFKQIVTRHPEELVPFYEHLDKFPREAIPKILRPPPK